MPCDTVQTSRVDLGKVDPALIQLALEALAASGDILAGTVAYSNGKLQIRGGLNVDKITRQVKQAYSAELIKSSAKKYGWTIKETSKYKYVVVKR